MKLPEIKDDLFQKVNPMNFDLYDCVIKEGGELYIFARQIREKLIQMKKEMDKSNAIKSKEKVVKNVQEQCQDTM